MSGSDTQSAAWIADRLTDWIAERLPGARHVRITDVVEPAQGFSSRTILFVVHWEEQGEPRRRELVARLQRDIACPLLSDVFHQFRVIQVAGAEPGVRVPRVFASEVDPHVVGQPFFIMDRVHGRVPPDFPSYHAEGWVADLDVELRTRTWWNGIAAMERLHRIPWHRYPSLGGETDEKPTARFYLEGFIMRWLDWAAEGRSYPVLETAIEKLIDTAPAARRSGLVWNDARMGNVMFGADLDVASLFDFEVATLGPAEIDVAWWLYADDIFSENFGVPRLTGIPTDDVAIPGFEQRYGFDMPDFDYYLAVAALKHAVISIRDYSNGKVIEAPEALPGFAIDRMHFHMDRHRTYAARR